MEQLARHPYTGLSTGKLWCVSFSLSRAWGNAALDFLSSGDNGVMRKEVGGGSRGPYNKGDDPAGVWRWMRPGPTICYQATRGAQGQKPG